MKGPWVSVLLAVVALVLTTFSGAQDYEDEQLEPIIDQHCFRGCLVPFAKMTMKQLFCNVKLLKPYHECSQKCFFDPDVEAASIIEAYNTICVGKALGLAPSRDYGLLLVQSMIDDIDNVAERKNNNRTEKEE